MGTKRYSNLVEPVRYARSQLSDEFDEVLSNLFDKYVLNPDDTSVESDLVKELDAIRLVYPDCVYKPFIQLYNELKEGELNE